MRSISCVNKLNLSTDKKKLIERKRLLQSVSVENVEYEGVISRINILLSQSSSSFTFSGFPGNKINVGNTTTLLQVWIYGSFLMIVVAFNLNESNTISNDTLLDNFH